MLRKVHALRYRATACELLGVPSVSTTPLPSSIATPEIRRSVTATTASSIVTPLRWCSTNSNSSNAVDGNASAQTSSSSSPAAASQQPKRKVQIAVVGSGPSGCFVASQLAKRHPSLHVDIFERLPVPFGLCRYGVAPDHPDVKNVEKQFMELFQSGRVSWIGNVSIGTQIPVQALLAHYAAVVFATGAGGLKKLRIPGEDLAGVLPARSFVEYYNTYPFPFGSPRFCPFDVERTKRVVVIGNGNVAMDVARVLAGSYKYFCPTDMNCVCLREMMKNKIEMISIVGRRGVNHSAFATAEFRELTKYQEGHVKVEVDPFALDAAIAAVPEGKTARAHKRMMELVHQYTVSEEAFAEERAQRMTDSEGIPLPSAAVAQLNAPPPPSVASSPSDRTPSVRADKRGPCTLRFRYNLTPVAILPSQHRRNCVGGVLFKTCRTAGAKSEEGESEFCVIPCDLVLTSIGCHAESIADIPFDHKAGVMDNVQGRVKGMPRVYCSGWAKNGAKGVILHSVVDAQETVSHLLADMEAGLIPTDATVVDEEQSPPPQQQQREDEVHVTDGQLQWLKVESQAAGGADTSKAVPPAAARTTMAGKYGLVDYFVEKKLQPVSVAGLQRILHVEHQRGVDLGKKAEKIDTTRDMLDVALGGDVGKKADERIRRITPARSDAMMYLKELLDDDTDLAPLAHELAKDMPHKLAQQHPLGRISPGQL
ncbi:Ferredoxin NADP reductase-like protein [Leptomonas seymouri]|uniref:Ferredoxin NADP reductase-like protein n=1 Tax=Leptomonas seymouri TaxID=5684 RepID=A0A0N1PDQ8_LEPSE|nr:Ferredoxin NADP reductase-like protein [Leptomonas seymouri]|eukprot:KPI89548.1 Ferredoxin NADP reductase-like protein [Leptomonas seymouri]